jgi:hypothetical protein
MEMVWCKCLINVHLCCLCCYGVEKGRGDQPTCSSKYIFIINSVIICCAFCKFSKDWNIFRKWNRGFPPWQSSETLFSRCLVLCAYLWVQRPSSETNECCLLWDWSSKSQISVWRKPRSPLAQWLLKIYFISNSLTKRMPVTQNVKELVWQCVLFLLLWET